MVAIRQGVRAWSLARLGRLAAELDALGRWWRVVERLPAGLQTQSLRVTIGRILYQHVKQGRRIRDDHPVLREASLKIARFIGRTPRHDDHAAGGVGRAQIMRALMELSRLLEESARAGLIGRAEVERCERELNESLAALDFRAYRQAALQAEYLGRLPQAVACLRAALASAAHLPPEAAERRAVEDRLGRLEAHLACAGEASSPGSSAPLGQ